VWTGKLWGQRLYIVVWPGKLLADSYFFIFFIYFNKTYIIILCYNNHAHTSLNQSSDRRYRNVCITIIKRKIAPNRAMVLASTVCARARYRCLKKHINAVWLRGRTIAVRKRRQFTAVDIRCSLHIIYIPSSVRIGRNK